MKKIILLFFLFCFVLYEKVDATFFYYDEEKVEGMFITRSDGVTTKSGNPYILKRRDDNQFVYCLEPLKMLDQVGEYLEFSYNDSILGLTNEIIDRINLIAYYGYLYPGHEDIKWYGITQYLIWKELFPYLDISFTDSRFGNKIVAYTDEVNELLDLVNRDMVGLGIGSDYDIKIGGQYVLVESELLNNYEIVNDSPTDVYIYDNKLVVSSDYEGNYSFTLQRKNRKDNNYFLYYNPNGQNLFFNGKLADDIVVNINSEYVNFTIVKHDFNGDINDYITLDGARYGIFDLDNNLIYDGFTLDGQVSFSVPYGRYIIREIEPSYGYNLEVCSYEINLFYDYVLDVYETKILKNVIIHKVYEDDNELKDEPDIIFNLYKNMDIIDEYITDLNGLINFSLPYGEYKVVQISNKEGYLLSDDIYLKIDENFDEQEILIINRKREISEEPVLEPTVEHEEPGNEYNEEMDDYIEEEQHQVKERNILGANYSEENYNVPNTANYIKYNLILIFIFISAGVYALIKIIR